MAICPDTATVGKQQKEAALIDEAIPSDSNIRRKEHKKLGKYQGLKEELEERRRIKAALVAMVIKTLGAVILKLGEWLQQILGKTSKIWVQRRVVQWDKEEQMEQEPEKQLRY
ncbi:uncharacterized protein V6R79_013592 [Siganus canaliculatus]